jgi:hypothetical protein
VLGTPTDTAARQRCFVYLDLAYTGADTNEYPQLRAAYSPSVMDWDVYLAYEGGTLDDPVAV